MPYPTPSSTSPSTESGMSSSAWLAGWRSTAVWRLATASSQQVMRKCSHWPAAGGVYDISFRTVPSHCGL